MSVIDLCAGGAAGWEYAARELGLDPLGIELDDAACAVRRAAGFRTLQADISALDPLDFAPCVGLVGGVPCPSFSMAGKGVGRAAIPFFIDAIERMARGEQIDKAELDEACKDETAHLVLEPLRWALALRPRWIAQEQVEPVLPLWQAIARALRRHGYSAWCGVVSAETFGTPQTRRRAILLASLDGPVSAPVATHQRYVAPKQRKQRAEVDEAHAGGMFDVEPERIMHREDRGLLPWVSMAQALGWTHLRKVRLRAGTNANDTSRPADEPAPTIRFGQRMNDVSWVTSGQRRNSGPGAEREPRGLHEPSYTVRSAGSGSHPAGVEWVTERPATTVANDPRVFQPGGHHTPGAQSENAVRVTIEEAAALQGFPPGHPWMAAGSKTAAYRCVGNAIPPQMALAALLAVGAGQAATLRDAA